MKANRINTIWYYSFYYIYHFFITINNKFLKLLIIESLEEVVWGYKPIDDTTGGYMKRINYFMRLSIVICPTVIITLLIFEKTSNYFYALLALIATCTIMTLVLSFSLKLQIKRK